MSKRADFLLAAQARRQSTAGFLLQARKRADDDTAARIGYTCSKKVGNAVARNRAKRRLREIARLVLGIKAQPGWDYVLVGRPQVTATRDFVELQEDLASALEKVHGAKGGRR
jgi:ribonuclease P protein component